MKKILYLFVLLFVTLPSFAVCSIDASQPCKADISNAQIFDNKYKPNNFGNNFSDKKINKSSVNLDKKEQAPNDFKNKNYNSNCQFGVCTKKIIPQNNVIGD